MLEFFYVLLKIFIEINKLFIFKKLKSKLKIKDDN